MEAVTVHLDDGTGEDYDGFLHDGGVLQEMGDLTFVTKDKATNAGNQAVLITFTVMLKGKRYRAQAATTAKAFLMAAGLIASKYPDLRSHGQ